MNAKVVNEVMDRLKEVVIKKMNYYREKKENNIFDDFFRSDLDFMETCIEIAESHGYQKKLDNPSDPGDAIPMSAEEFLEKVRELKNNMVEAMMIEKENINKADQEVIQFLIDNRYRILDNLDDAYTEYLKK